MSRGREREAERPWQRVGSEKHLHCTAQHLASPAASIAHPMRSPDAPGKAALSVAPNKNRSARKTGTLLASAKEADTSPQAMMLRDSQTGAPSRAHMAVLGLQEGGPEG